MTNHIQAVIALRPIQGFNPEMLLKNDCESFRKYWEPDAKLLWFHQYCKENGISGKVDTQYLTTEELKDIPSTEFSGNIASINKEFWTAIVYMNGEVISEATVSGTYVVNDQKERDLASNQLRKSAIGAALSQAGFGAYSGFDMNQEEIAQIIAAANSNGALLPAGEPTTVTPPVSAPKQNPVAPVQDSFFGASPVTPAPVQAPPAAPAAPVVVTPPSVAEDPLVAAKKLVWNGSGIFKGKMLGEFLGTSQGRQNLEFIANKYAPRTEEGRKLQEGARLILSSLELGK